MALSRRCSRGLSSIDSLPAEILSYIFILSTFSDTPQDDEQLHGFDSQIITTPLTLATVSRRWRQVALSTSSLWTSLCVTPDFVLDNSAEGLDTTHLTTFLHRSRKAPLRIHIDARDPDWDFTEPGVTYSPSDYKPPLAPEHVVQALSLLLPHLSRWRSLSIYTDTWSLMHTALEHISPALSTRGAPLLQSIALMRCNDFVSFGPTFRPSDLKNSPLFSFDQSSSPIRRDEMLPQLRALTLKGVHADWDSLSEILSSSSSTTVTNGSGGLHVLELSSHSPDVRPTLPVLQSILSSSPQLRKLIVRGSGFREVDFTTTTGSGDGPVFDRRNTGIYRMQLPHLEELQLGYRSALDGCKLMDMLDAPNLHTVSLHDDSHPADPETIDGSPLLNYIGSGLSFPGQYPARESSSSLAADNPSACLPHLPFPKVHRVVLDGVRASEPRFRTLFEGLPNIRSLELKGTPLASMEALLPTSRSDATPSDTPTCPSSALQSLTIYTSETLSPSSASLRLFTFLDERARHQAARMSDVSIYLDSHSSLCSQEEAVHTTIWGADVKVYEALLDDDSLDWMKCAGGEEDEEATAAAFKLGGPFNDPYFDSYYSSGTLGIVTR